MAKFTADISFTTHVEIEDEGCRKMWAKVNTGMFSVSDVDII